MKNYLQNMIEYNSCEKKRWSSGTEVVLRTSKMKEEHNERDYQKNRSRTDERKRT